MRPLLLALGLLTALPALAQEVGDTMFAARDADTKRFADAPAAGPPLALGDRVSVVYVDGARVRIARGERFGWVEADALTSEDPRPKPEPRPSAPPSGDFDLEALQRLLDEAR